jgi:hypothetical protein
MTREGPADESLDRRQLVFITLGLGFGLCWLTAGRYPVRAYATAFALVLAGLCFLFLGAKGPDNSAAADGTSPVALALWGAVMFGSPLWALLITALKAAWLERMSLLAWPVAEAWEVWQVSPTSPAVIDRVRSMLPPGSQLRAAVEATTRGPGAWAQGQPQVQRKINRRWGTVASVIALMATTGLLVTLLNANLQSTPILTLTVASVVAIYGIVTHIFS